ncbi:MAG: DNA polymerase I [Bacteroidales bacterium]|nr:DNA polymerase I [Bacteroidales bacterium]
MPETKKLFLLDAMALIYRAFYALNKNPRINSKGMNTSAIVGFANTLLDVIKNQKPTHIGVAFDTHAPTLRAEEFIAYKANRQAMPEDLAKSLPYIVKLIEGFNIPILFVDGYEADDVIGTLAKVAEQKDFTTYMMTSDKDFGQLVSDKTFIFRPPFMGNKAEVLGVPEVCKKFGIERPEQVIDMLGLWGDASDNIPGVPGIGEKRAQELIATYGTLENVLDHADELKGKMAENVREFAQQALDSKRLATIVLDVPIDFDEEKLKLNAPNLEALKEIFTELEFKTFAKALFEYYQAEGSKTVARQAEVQQDLFSSAGSSGEGEINTIENTPHNYYLLDTPEKRQFLIAGINKQKSFCFDTETTGTDPNNSELVGMSFALKPGEACYMPVPENYNEVVKLVQEFRQVFEDETIEKTGQNLKYDISVLRWYDLEVKGKMFDTMLAHYLIEPEQRHNMDFLSEKYLNYRPVSYEDVTGKKGINQPTMREVQGKRLNDVLNYAAEDADITLQLRKKLEPQLEEFGVKKLFDEIEVPLVSVLSSMEAEGIKLDVQVLRVFSSQLEGEIAEVEREIYTLSGEEFNIGSPKQLGIILFEKLNITKNPKKTKTHQYSTGEEVLSKLEHKHPVVSKILDYRSLTKLKSTYVDALPALISPRDGRLHTSYNQAVTSTGRLSSTNPNLQNIPIRTEKGREIRKAFVPRNDDYVLLAADYSQIELRIIAELSRDKGMMEAFIHGLDIHTATASKVFGVGLNQVTKEMRRNAKAVNFGIVYGISAFGLSEQLSITRSEAAEIIQTYFTEYPGVKQYMNESIEFARKNGYVETMMGRRRYLRDINSGNANIRGFAERNAINAPIQGSSADMIKIAMIRIYDEMVRKNLKSRMILQVHDELVFDTCKKELSILKEIVEEKMKNAIEMTVPIVVEINTGDNWLEAH